MTFDQIVAEACDKLNFTSSAATTRVGKNVNDRYRRLTSSIGLETTRRVPDVIGTSNVGEKNIIFTGIEKIIIVVDKTSDAPQDVVLTQITPDELHIAPLRHTPPRHYAVVRYHPNSVEIEVDCVGTATPYVLYADGMQNVSTLSGNQQPDFPESFHDILVWGALADDYRKMEKLQLMQDAETTFERRLSDLRMWIAKSGYLDIYQGRYSGRGFRWTRDAQLLWDQ